MFWVLSRLSDIRFVSRNSSSVASEVEEIPAGSYSSWIRISAHAVQGRALKH
jgi:hypothetical protein